MGNFVRKMSLTSRSLKPQLVTAFCLMSVIPILALLSFIYPSLLPRKSLAIIVGVILILAVLGFGLVKKIIDSIIDINTEARCLANGELSRRIEVAREDELGELGLALNQLASQIKNGMDELKIYGERTKDINVQINKQLIALSGLLEISNLMTRNADLKEIFEMAVIKITQVGRSAFSFVALKSAQAFEIGAQAGLKANSLTSLTLSSNAYLLRDAMAAKPFLKIDSSVPHGLMSDFLKILDARNVLAYPIILQSEAKGLVVLGNSEEKFLYTREDVELLSVFTKQLSIAVENSFLSYKVRELEIKDSLTGLFNRRYIVGRLDEEIMRAISHQRPCSFVAIRVKNLADIEKRRGGIAGEEILRKVAGVLKTETRNFDRVGRIADAEFGVVLPEKNKRQAQEFAGQIQEKIHHVFGADPDRRLAFWVAVTENPIDGMDAASLLAKVRELSDKEGC